MRAALLGHLDEQQSNATGGRVHEDSLAIPDGEGRMRKVVRGQALEHQRRGAIEADVVGNGHEFRRGDHRELGVARAQHVGDAVAGPNLGDVGADRLDDTGGFASRCERSFERVQPSAVVDVDEVDADRFDANQRFSRPRFRDRNIVERECFRSSRSADSYSLHAREYTSAVHGTAFEGGSCCNRLCLLP